LQRRGVEAGLPYTAGINDLRYFSLFLAKSSRCFIIFRVGSPVRGRKDLLGS
jgi:hypothetical protein